MTRLNRLDTMVPHTRAATPKRAGVASGNHCRSVKKRPLAECSAGHAWVMRKADMTTSRTSTTMLTVVVRPANSRSPRATTGAADPRLCF
ncbi:MAG: hypothetical protein M3256_12635 [Actinomycetota bacterium]|nr:hypothetical protein [Actinomycetota bacterium]